MKKRRFQKGCTWEKTIWWGDLSPTGEETTAKSKGTAAVNPWECLEDSTNQSYLSWLTTQKCVNHFTTHLNHKTFISTSAQYYHSLWYFMLKTLYGIYIRLYNFYFLFSEIQFIPMYNIWFERILVLISFTVGRTPWFFVLWGWFVNWSKTSYVP